MCPGITYTAYLQFGWLMYILQACGAKKELIL